MSPEAQRLITMITSALIIAAIIAIAKWITAKADKSAVEKLELKLDAALLIVGASITKAELTERLSAVGGRTDDKLVRILADILQANTDIKAIAKQGQETDKRLDDIPSRVRSLEETQKRS
jgi:hypothetical protein